MNAHLKQCLLVILLLNTCLASPLVQAEYGDVVLNRIADSSGVRPVVFPHWFHRLRFTCNVCHNENAFKMRAGSNDINMGHIIDGKFCGMCHNGDIAWGAEFCHRCHSGLPGLAGGFYGSQDPAGPAGGEGFNQRRH